MRRVVVGFILLLLVGLSNTGMPRHRDSTVAATTSTSSQGITNPGAP